MAATYYEIVVKGDDKLLKGFVRGLMAGRSMRSGIWLCDDHPFDEKQSTAIPRFHGGHKRLICSAAVRRGLSAAVKNAVDLGFEVLWEGKITRTYFAFEFETASRDAASKMKKLLGSAPTGVKITEHERLETVDADARGAELYSPVHDYTFRGRGAAEGPLESLLPFRTTLAAGEFFEVGDIIIEH